MKADWTGGGQSAAAKRPAWSVAQRSLSTARLLPIRLTSFSFLQRRHKFAAQSLSCSISAEDDVQIFSASLCVLRAAAWIGSEMIWFSKKSKNNNRRNKIMKTKSLIAAFFTRLGGASCAAWSTLALFVGIHQAAAQTSFVLATNYSVGSLIHHGGGCERGWQGGFDHRELLY